MGVGLATEVEPLEPSGVPILVILRSGAAGILRFDYGGRGPCVSCRYSCNDLWIDYSLSLSAS